MKKYNNFIDKTTLFSFKERWKLVYPSIRSYVRAKLKEGHSRADIWKNEILLEQNKRNTFAHQELAYRILLDILDELEKPDP